ncbi:MAG: putative toxin-antitoxin system toxin component, PIN family [Chloroflexota bacterium]
MRAVLDVNVLVSALIAPAGTPARLLLDWQDGRFELIVSPLLLAELERALSYPKLQRLVPAADAGAFVAWLGRSATVANDPDDPPPLRSADPGDDYLIVLASHQDAVLVSGDRHLLELAAALPILAPAAFLKLLTD